MIPTLEIERESARIDAERGKEAVATKLATDNPFSCFKVSLVDSEKLAALPAGTQLFLSPTIPEGIAKDAERYQKLKSGDYSVEKFVSSSYGWTFVPTDELDRTLDAARGERK